MPLKPADVHRYLRNRRMNPSMKVKKNPVMLLGVSLPFVIATAISLKSAAAMSMEMLAINLVTAFVAFLTANRLAFWIRAVVHVGSATVAMMAVRALITLLLPEVAGTLGTYIYLMALNGMALLHAELAQGGEPAEAGIRGAGKPPPEKRKGSRLSSLGGWLRSALVHTLVFACMMLAVSLPREYLGNGTLWGRPVPVPFRMPGMLLPFFGFIAVGFLLAAIKFLTKKITVWIAADTAGRDARDRARYTEIHIEP